MAKKREKQSLAEIIAGLEAKPSGKKPDSRPGAVDDEGYLFSPSGQKFALEQADLTPLEAKAASKTVVAIAFEGCGCGGNESGCTTAWLSADEVDNLRRSEAPILDRRRNAAAWIDSWKGQVGDVLFLHGSVVWGKRIG